MVLVEEGPPRGGLFELEQTTYHRVVDTRTQEVVLTFRGEMEASFSATTGSWEDYHGSGVREVAVAPDEKTVIVKYYDDRTETIALLWPAEAVLVESSGSLQSGGGIL